MLGSTCTTNSVNLTDLVNSGATGLIEATSCLAVKAVENGPAAPVTERVTVDTARLARAWLRVRLSDELFLAYV